MRTRFPHNSIHKMEAIDVPGARHLVIKWYVVHGKHIPNTFGAAGFEVLTAKGDTWKIVDDFDSGWMPKKQDRDALRQEVNALINSLVDFDCELRELGRSEQIELIDEEDMAL